MTFHNDIRLPVDIERGAKGGPAFKTTVITLSSGAEKRNKEWERTRGTWNIGYGETTKDLLQGVIDTFYSVNGSADGFLFKDWSDFQVGDTIFGDTSTKQAIGVGDGNTNSYQIFKQYARGSAAFNRAILKPVLGTVRGFLNSTEKTIVSDFIVDYTTGIITFLSAPGGTKAGGLLTFSDQPADTETVTIGAKVYTFQTSLTNTDGHVAIGVDTDTSRSNLIAAINLASGSGTKYAAATTSNAAGVLASVGGPAHSMVLTAVTIGAAGNSIATTETITNASWGASTLLGGTDLQTVYVMCEFDVPVRFVSDQLDIETEVFTSQAVIAMPDINIMELKDA